jgi:hypothetical protein
LSLANRLRPGSGSTGLSLRHACQLAGRSVG